MMMLLFIGQSKKFNFKKNKKNLNRIRSISNRYFKLNALAINKIYDIIIFILTMINSGLLIAYTFTENNLAIKIIETFDWNCC